MVIKLPSEAKTIFFWKQFYSDCDLKLMSSIGGMKLSPFLGGNLIKVGGGGNKLTSLTS